MTQHSNYLLKIDLKVCWQSKHRTSRSELIMKTYCGGKLMVQIVLVDRVEARNGYGK